MFFYYTLHLLRVSSANNEPARSYTNSPTQKHHNFQSTLCVCMYVRDLAYHGLFLTSLLLPLLLFLLRLLLLALLLLLASPCACLHGRVQRWSGHRRDMRYLHQRFASTIRAQTSPEN